MKDKYHPIKTAGYGGERRAKQIRRFGALKRLKRSISDISISKYALTDFAAWRKLPVHKKPKKENLDSFVTEILKRKEKELNNLEAAIMGYTGKPI